MPVDDPYLGCAATSCTACATANATPACSAGACAVGACYPGFLDCNHDPGDGCESDSRHDVGNCGACGNACGAGQICADGTCAGSCAPPLTACPTACADLLTDPQHCGDCGTACVQAGAVGACSAGQCSYTSACPAGYTFCGGTCVDTSSDVSNCGGCNKLCAVGDSVPACSGGQCVYGPPGTLACYITGSFSIWEVYDPQSESFGCGGVCQQVCGAGQYCAGGACMPQSNLAVVSGVAATALAVDGTRVYWADSTAGTVSAAPKAGGAPLQLASGQVKPVSVAVNSSSLYWANNLGGAIMSLSLPSGAPGVFAVASQPAVVLADDAGVAWWNAGDRTVRLAPVSGGAAGTLYTGVSGETLRGMVMNATTIYLWSFQNTPFFVGDVVTALPRSGGAPSAIDKATSPASLTSLVADDTYVYVSSASNAGGNIMDQIDRYDGAAWERVYGPHLGSRGTVTHVAGGNLYTGVLHEAPLCPLPIPYFHGRLDNVKVTATAWDAQYVYFSDGTATISRFAL